MTSLQHPLSAFDSNRINAVGAHGVLRHTKIGLFCSSRCPGGPIVKAYDFAQFVSQSDVAIVSGFQSTIEKDCFEILLRGISPAIVCPARRLSQSRVPREWQDAIGAGRMLLLSPFNQKQKRATAELAVERNRFVASIADEILIAYAHPGSKTEALCREFLASASAFTPSMTRVTAT